jgi:hypothetical protein
MKLPTIIWNDTEPPIGYSDSYTQDLHAEILAYLLEHLPKTHNLKLRMDAIQSMADDITAIAQRGKL